MLRKTEYHHHITSWFLGLCKIPRLSRTTPTLVSLDLLLPYISTFAYCPSAFTLSSNLEPHLSVLLLIVAHVGNHSCLTNSLAFLDFSRSDSSVRWNFRDQLVNYCDSLAIIHWLLQHMHSYFNDWWFSILQE